MPRDEGTVLVRPLDGQHGLVFAVESWSRPTQPHHVDISYYMGHGLCLCENYTINIAKSGPNKGLTKEKMVRMEIAAAAAENREPKLFTYELSCRHLRATWNYWLRHALPAYVASHQQSRKNHDE